VPALVLCCRVLVFCHRAAAVGGRRSFTSLSLQPLELHVLKHAAPDAGNSRPFRVRHVLGRHPVVYRPPLRLREDRYLRLVDLAARESCTEELDQVVAGRLG
jgi:hypothetical protein